MLMPYAPMAPSLFSFFVSSKREAWTTWFWLPLMLAVTTKPSAAAEMQRGNDCSPVLCGNVTISSPFGLVSEQSSTETTCGDLGFKVHCFNNTPYLGFFQKQRFQILNIFYDNGSMIVADVHKLQDFNSYNCHSPRVNSTSKLGFPFSISPVNQNLIFYNCTKAPIPASTKGLVEMGCGNNTFVRVAERYEESGSYGSYSLEGCSATLVPVLPGQRRTNASNYEELISDGFLLTWQQPSSPPLSGEKRPKLNIKLILVVLLSASTSLILTCLIWIKYCRKEKHTLSIQNFTRNASKIEEILEGYDSLVPKMYKYSELKKITGSFKDKLGEGGYSVVFKGNLEDGRDVAVKLLKGSKGNGEEFLNEVISIRMTSHVNVVNLIGFCLCGSTRALVYEYMDNGSLEKYIYSEESKMSIGWERLQQIAIGTARGLEYLHRGCNTRIIHFDIKPHNILLDKDFCPKIADFGLAKLCHLKDSSALSMAEARGTIGFIAPEVFSRGFGVVSTKSDVYSYGMMLLEMVGGRKNVKENTGNSCEAYFPNYIYDCLVKDFQSHEVISEMEEIARQMTLVGLWCIQTNPKNRPSMGTVIDMLEKNINVLEMPPKPFLSCPSVASSSSS